MTSPHVDDDQIIVMVTGAYPPDVCGVGDYTRRLMGEAPESWQLLVERDWSLRAIGGIVRRLLRRKPTTIIVQYPTQSYGWSLVPHLLIVLGKVTGRYRSVLALHEFGSLSRKSRLALALTSRFAAHIVFTTETERNRAQANRLFRSTVPSSVIGILSNIPWTDAPPSFRARSIDIAYFGHLRPNKGLEDFLSAMSNLRETSPGVRIAVIGQIPKGYEAFGEMVSTKCRAIDCAVILDLDDQAAGAILADTRILYLPFRDGVSARRGSVLAGLGNGAIIASPIGAATPQNLLPALIACDGAASDVEILLATLGRSDPDIAMLQKAGQDYIATTLPRGWSHVVALYQRAVAIAAAR